MDFPNKEALRCFLLPGGLLLLLTAGLLSAGVPLSPSALNLLFYVACAAGLMLSVRFGSSRPLLALLYIFLAQRAISFFAAGKMPSLGPGRIALETVSVLLPLNFLILTFLPERGLRLPAMARMLALAFFESIFVAVSCRAGETKSPLFIRFSLLNLHPGHGSGLPQLAILGFAICAIVIVIRVFRYRRPVEAGFFWSLVGAFIAISAGGVGRVASAYFATSVLAIASALIESSYVLAYQGELTQLPGRRAFNEMKTSLQAPFSIAVVDIDHFKSFNDSYGHDTGDQVLRMLAGRLAQVSGGGRAFRVGGEEFAIVFRDKTVAQVSAHLEDLRIAVENASFQVRLAPERRETPRSEPDRRAVGRRKSRASLALVQAGAENRLSVTVSIGVAEPVSAMQDVSAVYAAADKALYRAKKAGRNRVEKAAKPRSRRARLKSSIA